CRLPVLVERVAPGALVVTWSCGERRFTGILLDCTHRSGLSGLPPPALLPKAQDPPASSCHGWAPNEADGVGTQLEMDTPPPCSGDGPPEPPPALVSPPAGSQLPYPPYFEGAPFPHPLWLRHTYGQWVPQPPPRTIKRTRRRLSRNRAPGRLIMSTIRLRPRRVLCEKCQSSLSPEQASPVQTATPGAPRRKLAGASDREPQRHDVPPARKSKREEARTPGEAVPRSPVITISYSNPQGTGEVVKIPSRVHGSLEPFCPLQVPLGGSQDPEVRDAEPRTSGDRLPGVPTTSIPKLKLTRPAPSGLDAPPPKIRLKPQRPGVGEQEPVYRAELVEAQNGHPASPPTFFANGSSRDGMMDVSSGSSGEEEDFKRFPGGKPERSDLAFLVNYPSESMCTSDSLDESKSSSSEGMQADPCELSPGDSVPLPSSSKDTRPMVPPLTVRLHTQSVSKCVTEDGRMVAVGDIVWGKIHGFPWWPARVLDINLSQKGHGEPPWQEAKVSWFGSPTTSFLSLSKLAPFSEFFKLRFNRKKKGMYRKAITEAADAARHVAPEIQELLTQFET
ncbi:PREDICTED: PWWP domain-containing protein 2B, partial [Chrysochloris asiatica]|uniref:PWWP domain-containing protein 2B n=1 Tax=Chrysochloris asiatica TaxID=185453 RepID=A0A9B0WST8_CHRAS